MSRSEGETWMNSKACERIMLQARTISVRWSWESRRESGVSSLSILLPICHAFAFAVGTTSKPVLLPWRPHANWIRRSEKKNLYVTHRTFQWRSFSITIFWIIECLKKCLKNDRLNTKYFYFSFLEFTYILLCR